MKDNIRKFALVIVDDFDKEIDRFDLDYAELPKNLGFELEFTKLETRLTTYFTSAREKKIATTLNLNFLPPNAYQKVSQFKQFVQKYMHRHMIFEYDDTYEVKNWEGKVQKLSQEELTEWGGLVCPLSFLPGTPKYIRKDNAVTIKYSQTGKSYPFKYPYSYGTSLFENNIINNTYFDEIPLVVTLYGEMSNIQVSLQDINTEEVYASVAFSGLSLSKDDRLIIDSVRSKILLYRGGVYQSAYDYLDKSSHLDSFLFARENCSSRLVPVLDPKESGYLQASYRQYTL